MALVKLHCNELLALAFKMVLEMSQILALVMQPSRIGHV
jgi:hypothetical protein